MSEELIDELAAEIKEIFASPESWSLDKGYKLLAKRLIEKYELKKK